MTQLNVLDAARGERGGYRVDVSRGERVGRVSSEWFSRPPDERYLSLLELHAAVRGRAERSRTRTAETVAIRVGANRDDAERLALILPGEEVPLVPTHWSFGQLTTMIGAPSAYLRQLPAPLAAINLQYGLTSHRAELVKTLEVDDGRVELCAVTGPDYVQVPPPHAYFEPINWHRTALHELGHATGHRSRLNRDQSGSYGTKKYAFEELVAELAAAFGCASLGIVPTVRLSDYIGSWLEVLREDNRAIVRAASQASKATDYLLSFVPEIASSPTAEAIVDHCEAV
jgi:hypothetical protein